MHQEPTAFDFRRPLRLPARVDRAFAAWTTALAKVGPEKLSRNLPFDARLDRVALEPARLLDPPALPDPALVYRVRWGDANTPMLLFFSRQLLLALAESLIGAAPETPPADRELTSLELTLAESVAQDFVRAANEAQPGAEPPLCWLEGLEQRRQLRRLFPDDEELVHCRFDVAGPFGALPLSWLISMQAAARLVSQLVPEADEAPARELHLQRELIKAVPVELSVRLGGARIGVESLASLQPGDVIVLDQRVSEPLLGQIAGATKFSGWPCRVGGRQAFVVSAAQAET